ncbi:Phenylalanine--tRNA ligase beta subunit [Frankliniella fusca]|uniref:Phenylalanine--tRNA ligase beta subunit n=1 Tax=Frankliniella fusca TaxID=407009 RepID=A0AAE1GTM1_9NEOP|nr:Phenylalanine--tRNA ligase beta subunit [Frankliniella fusca]KAK3931958.1 Phenylalanine--tRNA ligase beta subunit [Frankliniella fusca]
MLPHDRRVVCCFSHGYTYQLLPRFPITVRYRLNFDVDFMTSTVSVSQTVLLNDVSVSSKHPKTGRKQDPRSYSA